MSEKEKIDDLDSYTDRSISLSNRYKKFVFLGFIREFASNAFSLISLFFVSRFVSHAIQDQMFYLSASLGITGTVAILGYTYSLTRKAIIDKHLNSEILYEGTSFLFIIGLPISTILNLILAIFVGITPLQIFFFLVSSVLYYVFLIIQLVEDIILQSNRNVVMQTIYNILSSISVPLFFVLFASLNTILVAWIFSLFLGLFYNRGLIKKLLANLKLNLVINYDIFYYGLPLYLLTIYTTFTRFLDTPILKFFFPVGTLSEYSWAIRIATTVFELFTVLMTGSFPLLTNYYMRQDYKQFSETIKSLIKIGLVIGLFLFGFAFIGGNFGMLLLLSTEFPNSGLYFKILVMAFFIRITPLILQQVFNARGNRRFIVEITLVTSTSRLFFLAFLAQFGGLGMAIIEVIFSTVFLLGTVYKERVLMKDLVKSSPKYILTMSLLIITLLILPSYSTFINTVIIAVFFFIIFMGALYFIKPFNDADYILIEKIIGTKFNLNQLFKKLFVS